MHYVMTDSEKRMQQNLLIQAWRFVSLSNRFMKLLSCEGCKYPPQQEQNGEVLQSDTGQPRRVV